MLASKMAFRFHRIKHLSQELEEVLSNTEKPSLVIETENMFNTIYSVRELSGESLNLIPDIFDGLPHLDNYDYWHRYLGLPE
jgi:hypothetical protein